ncbi:MAG: PAS domain S-box protein [Bacteroidetes bacterium]|nr:PAS domain S-box protein [Bacteroidota bacterium]
MANLKSGPTAITTFNNKLEEQYHRMIEEVEDYAIILLDRDGIIRNWNKGAEKIKQYSEREIIGKNFSIFYTEGDRQAGLPEKLIQDAIKNGKALHEGWRLRKDGSLFWGSIVITALHDEGGQVIGFTKVTRDLSDRKKSEELIRWQKQEIQDFMDSLSTFCAKMDREGKFLLVNKAAIKTSGLTREQLMATHFVRGPWWANHESSYQMARNALQQACLGFATNYETRALFSGRPVTANISLIPIKNSKDLVEYIIVEGRDITTQKKAMEQIAYMARMMEDTCEAIFSCDTTLRIRSWNKASENLYGIPYSEAIGQPISETVGSQLDNDSRQEILNQLYEFGHWKGETKHIKKDGTAIHLLISNTVTRDDQGKIDGFVSVVRDISIRKSLELQLKKANEDLEAFTYSVSHDLRAPLRGIIGFTSVLEEDYASKLDDEAKRIAGIIRKNTLHMGRLIDDLLSFSRMGQKEIQKTIVDNNTMVREIIASFTPRGKEQGKINWEIESLVNIKADDHLIRQVWINLISNAIKYTSKNERPLIKIGSYPTKDQQVFFVKDNGVGFDDRYKQKLFKVFQRLHAADEFEGTGVGLAIVERIIGKHGGKVWAEGKEQEGACFYFSLPF